MTLFAIRSLYAYVGEANLQTRRLESKTEYVQLLASPQKFKHFFFVNNLVHFGWKLKPLLFVLGRKIVES